MQLHDTLIGEIRLDPKDTSRRLSWPEGRLSDCPITGLAGNWRSVGRLFLGSAASAGFQNCIGLAKHIVRPGCARWSNTASR
jgi:hypothetical protein